MPWNPSLAESEKGMPTVLAGAALGRDAKSAKGADQGGPTLLTGALPQQDVKSKEVGVTDLEGEQALPTLGSEEKHAVGGTSAVSVSGLETLRNTWCVARSFFLDRTSRRKAWSLTAGVLSVVVVQTLLTLWLAQLLKQLTEALVQLDSAEFEQGMAMLAVLAAMAVPLAISQQWMAGALALEWRRYTTAWLLDRYINSGQTYYRMKAQQSDIDNPDQRIGQDVAEFTESMVKLQMTCMSSMLHILLLSAVLLGLCPDLFAVLVCGSGAATVLFLKVFGGRLMVITRQVLGQEATFRFSLIRVRENAEPIAFYQGAGFELHRCQSIFAEALRCQYRKLRVLSVFVGSQAAMFSYASLLPSLVLGPRILRGEMEFSTIPQVNLLFMTLLASFTALVADLGMIASVGAQSIRIRHLMQTVEGLHKDDTRDGSEGGLALVEIESSASTGSGAENVYLELKDVTLQSPHSGAPLLADISLVLRSGDSLLIGGESGIGKSSLLRAIGGLWTAGHGSISRCKAAQCFFVPQEPYLCLGTLRANATYPQRVQDSMLCEAKSAEAASPDIETQRVEYVLQAVNLGHLITRHGLDQEMDLEGTLSGGEKQRLGFARLLLRPGLDFALLDEATSALDERNEDALYRLLMARVKCHASVAHHPNLERFHSHKLLLQRSRSGPGRSAGGEIQRIVHAHAF